MCAESHPDQSSEFYRKSVLGLHQRLDRLANRIFPDPNMADEAFLYMMEKLEENDWARVKKYKGHGKLESFILATAYNLFQDYSRMKFSRPRVPAWIRRQGVLWEEVYRLLCLERMPTDHVIQHLSISGGVDRNPDVIEEAASMIREGVADCGKAGKGVVSTSDEQLERLMRDHSKTSYDPEKLLMAAQRIFLTERIADFLFADGDMPGDANDGHWQKKMGESVRELRNLLSLSTEERLLLRLVHQEGLSVSAAGRMLGLNSNQVSGMFRRLKQRISKGFKKTGIWSMW